MTGNHGPDHRKPIIILWTLLIVTVVVWILYALNGHQVVRSMYEGRSLDFLNGIIIGQATWPVEYYLVKADSLYVNFHTLVFSVFALILCFLYVRHKFALNSYFRAALCIYFAITALVLNYILTIIYFNGIDGLYTVMEEGPISDLGLTILYVVISWLLIGSCLILLDRKVINKKNCWPYIGFYIVAFLYLNILRERPLYGDIDDYVKAAFNLYAGEPLHSRYLYPPFWATCLQPLVPLGAGTIEFVCMILNYFSLLLMYVLLYKTLQIYKFSINSAALAVLVILCVNVPLLRTLGYVQVNFHVVNLILLSLILLPRNVILSALALSLAVHMKSSPIILILAFIIAKQWKWLIYFFIFTACIAGLTALINGPENYIYFFSNVTRVSQYHGITAFRDNSIDSFIPPTLRIFSIDLIYAGYITLFLKLSVLVVSLLAIFKTVKKNIYHSGNNGNSAVYNSIIVLLCLMTILSPKMWQHHGVFLILPFLVMLRNLSKPAEFILYLSAYYLMFLLPTFDFYPFSYKMLLGIVLCYILFFCYIKRNADCSEWFEKFNGNAYRVIGIDNVEEEITEINV